MDSSRRYYASIDLKSFYASVECVERGLNPLTTNLVVADESRTEKTICLAVSPPLKKRGIPGRPRLFEVVEKVKEINAYRQTKAPGHAFTGRSWDDTLLRTSPEYALDYIAACPRMALYIDYSTRIYKIYLKYLAPEDIHVYSIDEVFMDLTDYLDTYEMTAGQLATAMVKDIFDSTGISASAGVGTNLYLCKVAMDIVAKKMPADKNGARVAQLDEFSYRRLLWNHRPLTDFWRVGRGYSKKLETRGIYTMGDVARCSLGKPSDYYNENLLYDLFGINAELLIDHAWGWEPCALPQIKSYRPSSKSVCSGQTLQSPYPFDKARLIVKEMADLLALDLAEKGFVADQIVMRVGYDAENLKNPLISGQYRGEVRADDYGRQAPKHGSGALRLKKHTSSARLIMKAALELFDRIADQSLLVRRVNIAADHVLKESDVAQGTCRQLDLFWGEGEFQRETAKESASFEKEKRVLKSAISIKKKYGKNAILKGMNFEEGATAKDRNRQIGGHRA